MVTRSLEVIDLRYSLKRAKTLSFVKGSNSRKVARKILDKTKECVSDETVRREHYRQGLKPFHMIPKPLRTNMHIEDCKWIAEYIVQGISLIA